MNSSSVFSVVCRHATKLCRSPAIPTVSRRYQSSSTSSGGAAMKFTFASPNKAYYSKADVRQIDVPSFSGSFGILPQHVPMLAVLKPGVVTVFENDGSSKQFFVSSGSVTVNDDSSVQILAEEAVTLDSIDKRSAQEGLSEAQQKLASSSDEVSRAEAQIAVETYEALVASA